MDLRTKSLIKIAAIIIIAIALAYTTLYGFK